MEAKSVHINVASVALLQHTFENYFRDMFLNLTHLKYITCMHSFKAALIAFFDNFMT